MKPIIRVENLSKRYKIGGGQTSNQTFRETIVNAVKSPFKRNDDKKSETFWALKDVNFEINPGEVVGIIGRNGAGKSTLLKILSRITEPTTGKVELYGRVGSLLEVGTGFHQELTGRENIFLNGAILGMKQSEIVRKFDEIVDFSEIENFIDTPVKHYSSGMYTRLAFAVAANLEPEILIVDEVLAVGDADFQKKCLGKMQDVSNHGRTVIFVSHQMGSIAQLCQKAILLEKGVSVMQDRTDIVIDCYKSRSKSKSTFYTADSAEKRGAMNVETAAILNSDGVEQNSFRHDEAVTVRVVCAVQNWIRGAELRMAARDGREITVFTTDAELQTLAESTRKFQVDFTIPANFLRPGSFSLTFALFVPHQFTLEMIEDVNSFSVFDGGTKYAQSEGLDYGVVFSPCAWKVEILS